MDRDQLAGLLEGSGEAVLACRQALLAGARFWVSDVEQPASQLASTYEGREVHTRQVGIPTLGFPDAVRALRARGDRLVRLAAVDVDDVPYHFQLFLDDAGATVVACVGVDQRLGYRLRPGDQVMWIGELVARVSDEFPGWVQVQAADAAGRSWAFVDKAPIFARPGDGEETPPTAAGIRCRVVRTVGDENEAGPPLIVVSTAVDGVAAEDGTDLFIVRGEQLRRRHHTAG